MTIVAHKVAFRLRLSRALTAALLGVTCPACIEAANAAPSSARVAKTQPAKNKPVAPKRKEPTEPAPAVEAPAPSETGTRGKSEPKAGARTLVPTPQTPLPPVDTSIPAPALPHASREKMRACAEEWEKKKLATKSGLPMWRAFATQCLTR